MKVRTRKLRKSDFEQLSEFRYQMRRFERFSEQAAQGEGITPLQYSRAGWLVAAFLRHRRVVVGRTGIRTFRCALQD